MPPYLKNLNPVKFYAINLSLRLELKEFGIEIRETCDAYQKGQLPYGMEVVNGLMRVHEAERALIDKIASMRTEGFSYHRIAGILNTLGVETKQRTSRWHATTVMKILRKA